MKNQNFLQIFNTGEVTCFEHIKDTPSEEFHQGISFGRAVLGQVMFHVKGLAQLIKLMVPRDVVLTVGTEPVG